MPTKIVSRETKLLLLCAQLKINEADQQELEKIFGSPLDWDKITEKARHHRLLPLVYYNINKIRQLKIPGAWSGLLENSYRATLIKNMRFWREFCVIQDLFNKTGIEIIPLKGIILAETLYPNPGLRPMGDIDILIKESDLPGAQKTLLASGYNLFLKGLTESYWRNNHCHYQFINPADGTLVELHWAFAPPRPNKINLNEIWARSRIQCIQDVKILTLSPEDTLLSLCLHACKNIKTLQNFALINLCDIHEIIIQYGYRLDWNYIARKAKDWRIKGVLFYLQQLTDNYFGTQWPREIKTGFKPGILRKTILNFYALKSNNLYYFEAALLMLTMLDTPADRFFLILQKLSLLYKKGKIILTFHFKTR